MPARHRAPRLPGSRPRAPRCPRAPHGGVGLAVAVLLAATATAWAAEDRAVQLFQAGDWAAARAEFSAAVLRNDRDAHAHYYLGRLAERDGDLPAAVRHLERAVQLDDHVSDYHLWYGKALAEQGMRGSKLKLPFVARHVRSEWERAVALDPRNLDAREAMLDMYSMAPRMLGGNLDKARDEAQAIARVDVTRGHLAMARLAMRANDGAAVEREAEAAIALAPDTLRGYSLLAGWYGTRKQWPQAFATVDRYLARRPDDPYGRYAVGRMAAESGAQLPRGESFIRGFLAQPPRDVTPPTMSRAWLRLGQILVHEGREAEGRAAFQKALAIDPRNDDANKALK